MNVPSSEVRPWPRSADPSPREDGVSLLRLLAILRRRRWLLVIGFLVGGGGAALFAMSRPRTYRSEATVEVAPDTPLTHKEGAGDVTRSPHLWENHLRTQESLLRRPGLLAKVIESLPPESSAPYKDAPDPALALSADLEIDAIPSTFLIRITLTHDRKEHGPAIVNRLIELFIEDSNRRLIELKNGARDLLSKDSLPVLKQRMDEAESALGAFHERIGFGDLENQYAVLLSEQRHVHDRKVAIRLRALALQARPEAEPDPEDPDAAGRRAARATLEGRKTELEIALAAKATELRDAHPEMISLRRRLETVKEQIAAHAKAEAARRAGSLGRLSDEETLLAAEERKLTDRIASAREQISEFRGLELEVAAARELYNDYHRRLTEMKAISDSGLTSVRAVDAARNPRTAGLKPAMILALGFVIGIPFGILAVFVAEQIDDRVPEPLEAEAALGLDLLAVIPRFAPPAANYLLPLVPDDDPIVSPLEPFRRLRSEVASRLQATTGAKIVAVVSPNYGEGKSTISINLARVLALEGRRVLLFDADLRQPGLKTFLGNPEIPGLEQYLEGKTVLDRCLQPSRIPGVDVMGPTREFAGAAEVPGTVRFRAIWSSLRAGYDYVIVDTSPINGVAEAAVVASHVDAAIFVMTELRTGLRQAHAALRRIANHQVRTLGLVVNRSAAADAFRPETDKPRFESDRIRGTRSVNAVGGSPI